MAQKKGAVSGMMGFSHIGAYRQRIFLLLFVVVVRHYFTQGELIFMGIQKSYVYVKSSFILHDHFFNESCPH